MSRSGRSRPCFPALIVALAVVACGAPAPASLGPSPGASPVASPTGSPGPTCRPAEAAADLPWWNDRVFYEVFVRSFQDSDGDGIGDLAGLVDRLDYLNDGDPATTGDLGVTGLWLMPVAESPSYHGYDVVDYRAIEKDYGTTDDFKRLIAEAHRRGIAVIVDLVMNHTSRDHPWFRDSERLGSAHDDWYVWSPTHPGFAGPGGTPVWHKDGDRYYYAYFWEGMPDLNLENPAVTAELDSVARYWLEDLGVDGFRLDAIKHFIEDGEILENTPATHLWLEGFHRRVREVDPDALLVGEAFGPTTASASYVPKGVDLTFDFGLAGAIILGLRNGEAVSLAAALEETLVKYPPGQVATFLSNHDQPRVGTQLAGDVAASKVAATVLLTGPGVPFVYYGEEIGMTGTKPDERIRAPMAWNGTSPGGGFTDTTPWEPFGAGAADANVEVERQDPASLLAHYRALIRLRSEHQALDHGATLQPESSDPGILAVVRRTSDETLLVLANLSDEAVDGFTLDLDAGLPCGATFTSAETIFGAATATPPVVTAGGRFAAYAPLRGLGPKESVVIRLSP